MTSEQKIVGVWRESLENCVRIIGCNPGEPFVGRQLLFKDAHGRLRDIPVSADI